MVKFQPHPVPHERPAVPLPLLLRVLIVNVCPVTVLSPHAPCVVRVPVPDPVEFMVISASMSENPQPVVPRSAMSQFPARSDLTISPVVAEPGAVKETSVAIDRIASHTRRKAKQWFFMVFPFTV